jgi:trimethylamine--corrinoid protein Co-methyltransferase
MGGVNIIHVAIGNLEMMSLASYEKCLIDNEILGAAFRMLQGVDCSRDAIGAEVFKKVGHSGNFLQTGHTLKYLRKDRWQPKLTDRNSWDKWQKETGGKDMRERAKDRVQEILKNHTPLYMDEEKAREIDRIASAAQKEIAAIRQRKGS